MILHLEERGKGAIGTPLHMLALHRLNLRQMAGVEFPVTSDSWAAYASELEHFAASAGGVPDEIMVNHLRMALYAFTDADLRSETIKAAATVTTAIDVTTAVATAIDTHTLTVMLATRMRDPTAANPRATLAVTDAQTDTLTALYTPSAAQIRPKPGRTSTAAPPPMTTPTTAPSTYGPQRRILRASTGSAAVKAAMAGTTCLSAHCPTSLQPPESAPSPSSSTPKTPSLIPSLGAIPHSS